MVRVSVNLREEEVASLGRTPDEMPAEMRTAAAIFWYSQGQLSMERAAQVAGLTRAAFLFELSRRKINIFSVDLDELKQEIAGD
jgi:predicted HTH domain antitoxin